MPSSPLSYSDIINAIKSASAFDLYRLSCAIDIEMESPKKVALIRQQLRIGMQVSYFDSSSNRSIPCKVIKLDPVRVKVVNLEDNSFWSLPYYMINVDSNDTRLNTNDGATLTKNDLQVGDLVGFTHHGHDHHGMVIRLNHKTATIITSEKHKWRVGYNHLHKIIDGTLEKTMQKISQEMKIIT